MVAPFPFESLPRFHHPDLALLNAAAGWLHAELPLPSTVMGLALSDWRRIGVGHRELSSAAALVWLVREDMRALLSLPGEVIRELCHRLLAAPLEVAAPRPLTGAEQAVAAMACASGLQLVGAEVKVEPWQPFPDLRAALRATEQRIAGWPCLELGLRIDGRAASMQLWMPPALVHRAPRPSTMRAWHHEVTLELPIVVAAAPLEARAQGSLRVRDVIVVEPAVAGAELRVGAGAIALRVAAGGSHATIESSYVRRVMEPLPDDLMVELTVTLGTVALSLRQISELSVGQVVALGRPLHGPFEVRVAGKVIGSGELVDLDGGLGLQVTNLNG